MFNFIYSLGYIGIFLAGFFSTFTLFLPSPTFVLVFAMSKFYNPILIGILGGAGAAFGEMIGYYFGYGITYSASKIKRGFEKKRAYLEKLFRKYKPSIIIFIFAALPIVPFDLVGLFCGIIKYNTKHFFILTLIGKIIKYLIISYAGVYGIDIAMSFIE